MATFYLVSHTFLNIPHLSCQKLDSLKAVSCVWPVFVLFTDHICPCGQGKVHMAICSQWGRDQIAGGRQNHHSIYNLHHCTGGHLCGLHISEVINYSLCAKSRVQYQIQRKGANSSPLVGWKKLYHSADSQGWGTIPLFSKTQWDLWTSRTLIAFSI